MESAGLLVEKLPGPPGKREMLRATRPAAESVSLKRFNVRVYFFLMAGGAPGALFGDRVLLSDEIIAGRRYTKWPGGGLEFGEGPEDCARREAVEELGQPINLGPLVHATGEFVRSAWRPDEQVLCHYYLARLEAEAAFRIAAAPFEFEAGAVQSFRWVDLDDLDEGDLSFATDRAAWRAFTAHRNAH
jgi:8-oxo-dGTP pyrophosphatase MutT (NUDIX family)